MRPGGAGDEAVAAGEDVGASIPPYSVTTIAATSGSQAFPTTAHVSGQLSEFNARRRAARS